MSIAQSVFLHLRDEFAPADEPASEQPGES
jgi:hypothetical protein